ncbi:YjdF family protein [Enterococcus sp. 669A]|uniref:YjdF family protein n=1 Tax=Candidatus Enterococcus moelleringii TaxID=2815325 RepID=A0ABS3L8P0_9ENTE|nr:YjdF family protein [Enterococcus sp. 669A]MBO1305975.1 YjdF family protein [Enterococcus sp. 669A]
MKLTIYFDGSFWCGLIELDETKNYQAIRYVFGPEPKDSEVFDFVCQTLPQLLQRQNVPTTAQAKPVKKVSPKRMQRLINREKRQPAVSTKAQQAMSEAREAAKTQRRTRTKAEKAQLAKEQFDLRQAKKRQKKRGH